MAVAAQGSRWQSGTGLGLYHVKELATSLGGAVGYQPNVQEGSGSVFWADIPYIPAEDAPSAEPSAPRALERSGRHVSPLGHRARFDVEGAVLIAEDNLFIQECAEIAPSRDARAARSLTRAATPLRTPQELTAELVRSVGVKRVHLAANGVEGLATLTAGDAPCFALVLMDVQVPSPPARQLMTAPDV